MRGIQRGWYDGIRRQPLIGARAGGRRDQNVLLKSGGGHELGIRVED